MSGAVKTQGRMATPAQSKRTRMPRSERREQLLDSALRLIARDGFAAASMEAIAREAEIAKTVVYDNFGDLDELLVALFVREQQRTLTELAAIVPVAPVSGEPKEILAGALTALLEAVHDHPDTWRLILLPASGTPPGLRDEVQRHRERLLGQIEPVAAWGMQRLGLGELDPELASHAIFDAAEGAVRLTLTDPKRFPPERIARFATDLLTAVADNRD
jgi:AcrR family transcriptional regulator